MNKILSGIVALTFPFFTNAEINMYSEVLLGQSKQKIDTRSSSESEFERSASSDTATTYGIRLGAEVTRNLALEVSHQRHGEVKNEYSYGYWVPAPGLPGEESAGAKQYVDAKVPVAIDSTRLGVKLHTSLSPDLSINARLGIAHWNYEKNTPHMYAFSHGDKGNDFYYGVGTTYQISNSLYVGMEYSYFQASHSINDTHEESLGHSASYEHDIQDISISLGWSF